MNILIDKYKLSDGRCRKYLKRLVELQNEIADRIIKSLEYFEDMPEDKESK